jgi:hypothetical protein
VWEEGWGTIKLMIATIDVYIVLTCAYGVVRAVRVSGRRGKEGSTISVGCTVELSTRFYVL